MATSVSAAINSAPTLCTMLPVRPRTRSSPMVIAKPTLTSSAASVMSLDRPVDVAAGDVMADLEDDEQHGE